MNPWDAQVAGSTALRIKQLQNARLRLHCRDLLVVGCDVTPAFRIRLELE